MLDQTVGEIYRIIRNLIRIGKIAAVDANMAKVRVKLSADLETKFLPFVTVAAGSISVWNPPVQDEQVVVLSPNGDLTSGIVIRGIFSSMFPAPSKDLNQFVMQYSKSVSDAIDLKRHQRTLKVKKIAIKNDTDELFSLVVDCLKAIKEGQTPTVNGPQYSSAKALLEPLIAKIEKFVVS